MWGLAIEAENRVDVGVVARATKGHLCCKHLKVKLATILGVALVENSSQFNVTENTAKGLHGFLELLSVNSSVAPKIEVLKESLNGLALIFSSMSSLANLLEKDALELSDASSWHNIKISVKSPDFSKGLAEVSVSLPGEHAVPVHIVVDKTVTRYAIILSIFAKTVMEFRAHHVDSLLARGHTGVVPSSEHLIELVNWDAVGSLRYVLPSLVDNV